MTPPLSQALEYRSPLLDLPGAVEATGADSGVAMHYGDPTAEQRALETGRGVVDQSHLGVVTVTGPDRLSWLNSIATQEVATLEPGESSELMILTPQGRVEHVAAVVDDGETTWLISETAPGLAAFLDRMRFMLRVEVADASADWAAIGEPSSAPGEAGTVTWVDQWPTVGVGGTSYRGDDAVAAQPRPWRLVLVPRQTLGEEFAGRIAAGAVPAGTWASEALRIAAHRPRAVLEVDETTLAHELDWLRTAVHLHKGCYRGQETVAKVHNVGRPPRRLTMLHLDGSDHLLPAPGDQVVNQDGTVVGRVTSAARHHELGPVALAVIKRSTDPSLPLTVTTAEGPVDATQQVIVSAEGFSADRPPAPGPTMKGLLMGKGCAADGGDLP